MGFLVPKHLRTIFTRLLVKGYKNAKKLDMIEKIKQIFQIKKAYNSLQYRNRNLQASAKTGIQCLFCLMNILFLDGFVSVFSSLAEVASRIALNTG
jgi:hypothetical protein